MGSLRVMDGTGDTRMTWSPDSQEEVDAAKETFEKLVKKGYAAFSVSPAGDKGEQIKSFDPKLAKIILAPQLRGG